MIVDRSFKAGIISRKDERSISRQTLTYVAPIYFSSPGDIVRMHVVGMYA